MELKDKVALITGGASGLGQATVEAFVSKGAKVVILDINEEKANEIINNLGEDNVMFISTDIMQEDPVVNAVKSINKKFGESRLQPARLLNELDTPDVISPSWRPNGFKKSV